MSESLIFGWLTFVVWVIGGLYAIRISAEKEQQRLGGKLYSHLLEDIEELPIPACFGYMCVFIGSWLSVINLSTE